MKSTHRLRGSVALSPVALVVLGAPMAACVATDATDEPAALVSFPDAPPDGPMPDIGPAPEDYQPTAAGAPSTDIWIGRLVRDEGALSISDLGRATNRAGYDNQPSFTADGSAVLYVSAVDRTQTEVMRISTAGDEPGRVTRTVGVSEFSPTPIPGQNAFSAIHEIRGKQYLWRYALDGAPLGPIFATAEPVGYHAWATDHLVAMFILGSPATLQLGDALTGEIRVVAERPGRSIHRIPNTIEISFVRKVSDEEWWIERLDPATGSTVRIVRTLPGREDYAWTPRGEIIMGDGSMLHRWTEPSGWQPFADLSSFGVEGITRLAVNADGSRIAVVANGLSE